MTKLVNVAINGNTNGSLTFSGVTCRLYCPVISDPNTGKEQGKRYWSDKNNWPN